MEIQYAYVGDILKADPTPDGLMVYGTAATSGVDLDGQICDQNWLKGAMPDWFQWGNVREQHSAIAAGVGKELDADGDKWQLRSLIVDQNTRAKVEAGVLKGYSVGIKGARLIRDENAPNGRIVGGKIVEVSLVDRPCNPDAVMSVAKAEGANLEPVDQAGEVIAKMDGPEVEAFDVDDEFTEEDEALVREMAEAFEAETMATMKTINRIETGGLTLESMGAVIKGTTIDETGDIQGAMDVIGGIARLIVSEAGELAKGRMEESYDISLLMQATNAMQQFLGREESQNGREMDADDHGFTQVSLAVEPDVTKRDFSQKQRDAAADSGAAMPDGSFPIKSKGDLQNAVALAGKAKDPEAAKAHIKKRAAALGATDMLPDSWDKTATADDEPITLDLIKTITAQAVADALTEVSKSHEAETKSLRDELAKVLATPIPGGPVLIAPRTPTTSVPSLTKAEEYRLKAAREVNPILREGYLQLADQAKD